MNTTTRKTATLKELFEKVEMISIAGEYPCKIEDITFDPEDFEKVFTEGDTEFFYFINVENHRVTLYLKGWDK